MNLSLREKNTAKKRIKISKGVQEWLEADNSFEDLSVKNLCQKVEVSETTFYKNFPTKRDLVFFMGRIWSLELMMELDGVRPDAGLRFIKAILLRLQDRGFLTKKFTYELTATFCLSLERIEASFLTPGDIHILYPNDVDAIIDFREHNLISLIREGIKSAHTLGELKEELQLEFCVGLFVNVVTGSPCTMKQLPEIDKIMLFEGAIESVLNYISRDC